MTHEQHLALDLIARLANRFGPASCIAKELPGWLEYLTEADCPERPRTRPSTQWWNKGRAIARDIVPAAGGGEGEIVQRNAALLRDHFGLSPVETPILTLSTSTRRSGRWYCGSTRNPRSRRSTGPSPGCR